MRGLKLEGRSTEECSTMFRMPSSWARSAAICASLLSACSQAHDPQAQALALGDKVAPSLQESLRAGMPVVALVELAPAVGEPAPSGTDQTHSASTATATASELDQAVAARAAAYQRVQQDVLDALDPAEVELITRYQHVPFLYVRVNDEQGLSALAALDDVQRIHAEQAYGFALAESLPLIRQPAAAAAGKTGAGASVAVLDTGCDFTRSAFGNCTGAGGDCNVAYAADFAADDGARDDNGHGTNVSAIVLGVAPSSKVLALDVFAGASAASSSILSAIDWTIQNRATYNIAALNMSLGSGAFTAPCANDVFASALSNVRAAGIVPVVASGNNGYTNALASPACAPAAVSVGAVYDANIGGVGYAPCSDASTAADRVACFSNSASFLSLLAPGAVITAGGYSMTGTSQAAPHVAGAAAVLRAAFASESVDTLVSRMVERGPSVTDARNNVSKRRLDLAAALEGASSPSTPAPITPVTPPRDVTPPTGSLSINGGASATNKTAVTLAIAASDASGVAAMCVSNTTSCKTFVPFTTATSWGLAGGDGAKTVYVSLRDSLGNVAVVSAKITLDTTAPTGATLRASAGNANVALSWSAATDSGVGVASYRVYAAANNAPGCASGSLVYEGSALSFRHEALQNGATFGYRVCPVDRAGNVGTGSTALARPAPEYTPPTGSVRINGGATLCKGRSVTLTLAASDASGVGSMCISNSTSCTSWLPYANSVAWSLGVSDGTAKVYVWYRDIYANAMSNPVSASIDVDSTPPKDGALSATSATGSIALRWTAASDTGSVASYRLSFAVGTRAPAGCSAGAPLYEGSDRQFTYTGVTKGSAYSYRVCAIDRAGNTSAGATLTVIAR